jgi:antibiotic biosynthesis monooxygenase (ABM) superfamily enzyme
MTTLAGQPQTATRTAPSRLRFAFFVFLGVYPLVTLAMMVVTPLTAGWPLPLRTLVMVPIIVVTMVWGIIPFIQTRLRRFL